jgi:hypothetical protein
MGTTQNTAALYLRKSSLGDRSGDNRSITDQRHDLERLAERHGLQIVAEHEEKVGTPPPSGEGCQTQSVNKVLTGVVALALFAAGCSGSSDSEELAQLRAELDALKEQVATTTGAPTTTDAPTVEPPTTTGAPTTTDAPTVEPPTTTGAPTVEPPTTTDAPTTTGAPTTTDAPTVEPPTTTDAPTVEATTAMTSDLAWKPGTYLARHCEGSTDSGFVTEVLDQDFLDGHGVKEVVDQDCRSGSEMDIKMSAEVVVQPESSEQAYGVSQYVRIFDFMDDNPNTGQFGLWGQWIGSHGAHPNGHFNSIEGGLFIQDKMGRSRFPKYMASAATHLYSAVSDTGGGWGFYERRIDCSMFGRVTLSNRMIVPPNLIAFDADQETHDDEGGIFVGTSWVALPMIGGAARVDNQPHGLDGGLMTWTFIIDAANYSGPLIGYAPEHWSRRIDRFNAMEILDDVYEWNPSDAIAETLMAYIDGEVSTEDLHTAIADEDWYGGPANGKDFGAPHWVRPEDTLGFAPADGYIPTGIEMPGIPSFEIEGSDGRTFLKVFPPQIPNAVDREPFVLNVQSFDVDLYNHFLGTFQSGGVFSDADFEGLGIPMQVERWDEAPWAGIEYVHPSEGNLVLRVPLLPFNESGETNIVFNWGGVQQDKRGWSSYYEIIEGVAVAVSAAEVPAELLSLEYGTRPDTTSLMRNENPTTGLDSSCYTCEDPTGCDDTEYKTVLDDGSQITYRWYRFRDQPVFHHLRIEYPDAYSDAVLDDLQVVIETMHSEWGGTHTLLERPTGVNPLHLAEVDHGLLVEPPAGKENGWVPIVLEVELPDGTWQEEIDFRESGGTNWNDY